MRISARVENDKQSHHAVVTTANSAQTLAIAAKTQGGGSAVNGGELLMLALATCYCNDIYREAARANVPIERVEVEASADFEGVGLAATNITYRARVASPAPPDAIATLLRETDAVAEVHNTVRAGTKVTLLPW
jgi:uncharacterized OsmC-like protein